MSHWGRCFVDSLVHDFGVFQFACSGLFQLKKKINGKIYDGDDDGLLEREITLAEGFKLSTEAFGLFSFQ